MTFISGMWFHTFSTAVFKTVVKYVFNTFFTTFLKTVVKYAFNPLFTTVLKTVVENRLNLTLEPYTRTLHQTLTGASFH